jgi:hypothetical protein
MVTGTDELEHEQEPDENEKVLVLRRSKQIQLPELVVFTEADLKAALERANAIVGDESTDPEFLPPSLEVQ